MQETIQTIQGLGMNPKQFEECAETLVLSALGEGKDLHLKALQM